MFPGGNAHVKRSIKKKSMLQSRIGRFGLSLFFMLMMPLMVLAQCTPPAGIPKSEMILWLCPDSGVYNASGDPALPGEDVHEWHDLSGNNWVFENTRNNRRPMLVEDDGNTYLNFNPGDFLSNIPIHDSLNGLNEFSIFIVLQSRETNTDNGFLYHQYPPNGADEGLSLRYDAAGANTGNTNLIKSGLQGNVNRNQVETSSNTQTTNRQTIAIKWNSGGRIYTYLDGVLNDSSDNNVNGPLSGNTELLIGKGAKDNRTNRGWDGYIGGIVFYTNQFPSDTISDITTALPIELSVFEATAKESKVLLDWTTSSEINNDYFTIEKTKDGKIFEEVVRVDGAGNSQSELNYSAVDKDPYPGKSYYRLKQTDFNGEFEYSNLEAVNYEVNLQAKIIPNPISGKTFDLNINGKALEDEILLQLHSMRGSKIFSMVIPPEEGMSSTTIRLPRKLSSGVYLLVGNSPGANFQQKLIVE